MSGSHRDNEVSGSALSSDIGLTVGTEAALQSLGGQFGSHAVKLGAQSDGPARVQRPATRPVDEIPYVDSRGVYSDSLWIVVSR